MKFETHQPKRTLINDALIDLSTVENEDIYEILSEAIRLKVAAKVGEINKSLENKKVALITNQKIGLAPLTFWLSVCGVGGKPITVPLGGSGLEIFLSSRESMEILSRLGIDAFIVQTAMEDDASRLYNKLYMPVVNAFDGDSPCDALSMLFSVYESLGKLYGLNVAYVGSGKKVTSTLSAFVKCGMNINFVCPEGDLPDEDVLAFVRANVQGGVTHDFERALSAADVVFLSDDFNGEFRLTKEIMKKTLRLNAVVLHTSPLTGAKDADENIMDDNRCLIAKCGENLVYIQSAILELLLCNNIEY